MARIRYPKKAEPVLEDYSIAKNYAALDKYSNEVIARFMAVQAKEKAEKDETARLKALYARPLPEGA